MRETVITVTCVHGNAVCRLSAREYVKLGFNEESLVPLSGLGPREPVGQNSLNVLTPLFSKQGPEELQPFDI